MITRAHLLALGQVLALLWLAALAFGVVSLIGAPLTCSAVETFGTDRAVVLVLTMLVTAGAGAVLALRE